MDKVSIIIPVYNVEKYLNKCLDSVMKQTYYNIEIILVDDGSIDSSGEICDSYSYDERIHVYHIKNQGVANARNFGLENSTGKYITFIDGDDWIEPIYVEKLVNTMQKTKSEMVICGAIVELEDGTFIKNQSTAKSGLIPINRYINDILLEKAPGGTVVWNKLYNKSVLIEKFQELSIGEDIVFLISNISNVKKIYFMDEYMYHYVQRNGSARVSSFSEKHLDTIRCANIISKYIYKNHITLRDSADLLQYNYYIGTVTRMLYWGVEKKYEDELIQIKSKLDVLYKNVCKNPNLSKTKRYSYLLYKKGKFLYKLLITIYYNNTLYKVIKK